MESLTVVVRQDHPQARQEAKRRRLQIVVQDGWELPTERVLFVGADQGVPWPLVESGFGALDTWEMACPLWRYGVLAADVGTADERARTKALCFDLRVPLMEPGLLFARQCEGATAMLEAWRREGEGGADERLAFLRALCMVKPRLLTLPRSWLAPEAAAVPGERQQVRAARMTNLVHVEIAPGRSVCCRPEEVEYYKRHFAELAAGRRR